jgi:hypothetical protein
MSIYKQLDKSYYLLGDGPLPVLSDNKNGCVTLAFETKEYGLNGDFTEMN